MLRGQPGNPLPVAGTECDQQFVILPVSCGLRRGEARAHGKEFFMNAESQSGGRGQPWKVGSQTVGKVHHGGGQAGGGQYAALPDPWNEGKMVPRGKAAAEHARDGEQVSRARRAAQDGFPFRNLSGEGHADDEAVFRQAGAFSSGNADAELPCQPSHSPVNSFHLGDGTVRMHEQGHQRVKGCAAHGRYV